MAPKQKSPKNANIGTSEKTPLTSGADEGAYRAPTKGILSTLPSSWVPFAELIRLEQPHGNYMCYFPHAVGLLYASAVQSTPVPLSTLGHRACIFAIWTFFLRGAGCAWNDIVDQDLDRQTARCRNRPVARGAVSTTEGVVFALALTALGLASLQPLPRECSYVALGTIVLAIIYPFGKRFTHFAQVILGSTLASTISLAAYSVGLPALSASYVTPTLCLSAAIMLLVVFYDVVYARRDTADDLKSGVKGMAVRFRNHLEGLFAVITISIVGLLMTLGTSVGMGQFYYMFSIAGLALWLVLMVALTHWQLLESWNGFSGWCYALAIAHLITGFVMEACVKSGAFL